MSSEPGPGELARMFEDFRRDVRDDFAQILQRLDKFVLREVYETQREADQEAIKDLKKRAESRARDVRVAVLGGLSAIAAAIVVAILTKSGAWQ
jgi:hypothetical protein